MDSFAKLHPAINFIYFVLVMIFTMCFLHPVYLGLSFTAAFCYSVYLKGLKGLRFNLCLALPMLILATLFNPLFNHEGATILWYFSNGNPLTLESIWYGLAFAAMFVSVILWFSCYNVVMTSDKFIYIFGRIIPSISLVFSMVLRFVPRFRERAIIIINGQKCIGRDPASGNFKQRLKNGMRIVSIMTTWALENGIETADSMTGRGYGLKGRTSFADFRFDSRDKLCCLLLVLFLIPVVFTLGKGFVYISYYPLISLNALSPAALINYCAYGLVCFFPFILDLTEDIKWHVLKSKI